ncbi:MAG TPA: hypothetical protein VFH61_17880 [Thermoleophilia bacterium]|nr:hypothetical protein [Thermoleophilia bacterium]
MSAFELERYPPGAKADWVPRSASSGSPGGQHGATHGPHAKPKPPSAPQIIMPGSSQAQPTIVPATQAQNAFDKAREEGAGRRFRVTIDKKMSDGQYRVTCDDTLETAWVDVHELEPLDSISQLGDLVGPRGKSLKDGLDEIEDEVFECFDCGQPIVGSVYWMGKQARDEGCRNKKLGK